MKKFVSIVLSVLLILPVIASFGVGASAENTYEELWAEKIAYEKEDGFISLGEASHCVVNVCYGDDFGEGGDAMGYGWAFLLFTEQGQKLTYRFIKNDYPYEEGYNVWGSYWHWESEDAFVCVELKEMIESCENLDPTFAPSARTAAYRNVVQTLGITSEELHEAYRKMREEPEYARNILSYMDDAEFAYISSCFKECRIPPNFVIEAACLADDDQAEMLLAVPGNVYIKERGYTIPCIDIYATFHGADTSVEEFKNFDLTTDSFDKFFADMESGDVVEGRFGPCLGKDGRTPKEKHEYLLAELDRQLAAKETGDSTVTSVLVLALAVPTLGALVWVKKKRRI